MSVGAITRTATMKTYFPQMDQAGMDLVLRGWMGFAGLVVWIVEVFGRRRAPSCHHSPVKEPEILYPTSGLKNPKSILAIVDETVAVIFASVDFRSVCIEIVVGQ